MTQGKTAAKRAPAAAARRHPAAAKKTSHKGRTQAATVEPWDKANPKPDGAHHPLSPQAKASAKRRAKAAGRPYPNLVDNMHAAADDTTS